MPAPPTPTDNSSWDRPVTPAEEGTATADAMATMETTSTPFTTAATEVTEGDPTGTGMASEAEPADLPIPLKEVQELQPPRMIPSPSDAPSD